MRDLFLKRIGGICLACCLLLLCASSFIAADAVVTVMDGASLLSSDEIESLQESANSLSDVTGWDIFALTLENTGADSAQKAAEDYFVDNASQDDGVVYLIDMDYRELYIATSGKAVLYLTDERIEHIMDDAFEYASDGDYAGALLVMLEDTQGYYRSGIPKNQYTYDEDTGEILDTAGENRTLSWTVLIAALGAGAAVAAAFAGIVVGRYQMKLGKYHYDWRAHSKASITLREDRHVNHFVTRRHIPRDPPPGGGMHGGMSGGGSSVHTGSGGHTFGGGGRSF